MIGYVEYSYTFYIEEINKHGRTNIATNKFPIQDDPLTRRIIAYAIEVHRKFGPGLLEKLYKAMVVEMELNGLKVAKNVKVPVEYKGKSIGDYFIHNSKMVKDGIKRFVV